MFTQVFAAVFGAGLALALSSLLGIGVYTVWFIVSRLLIAKVSE